MAITKTLLVELLRESLVFIAGAESRTRQEIIEHMSAFVPEGERYETDKSGRVLWQTRFLWSTVGMVKANWLTKDGNGVWAVTPEGHDALVRYPDPESFYQAQEQAYLDWDAKRKDAQQRAWLIRGTVPGANLVSTWLAEGRCSVAASQLPEIEPDISRDDLEALAASAYGHLNFQERTAKVAEIVDFVTRMKPGDLVLTTSDDEGIFVGDLEGGCEYVVSEDGHSNLRRGVAWRNPDAGVDFSLLPASLQAKLKTGAMLADLTAERANVDNLTTPVVDELGGTVIDEERAREHRFEYLPADAAQDLLVDQPWLRKFVDALNESYQVVLFGPPGTGKTFLAREIAERLVGAERTRLVQFHPSYTYEDFFEGYRPSRDSTSGGVSLELRAGPLRKLATEAHDHPDQAFVMIIDELNRANIAKVFGELYFLLEYRDDPVEVMYGGDQFTLPKNLYFIATMNTADRSIALLDSAMRRRFAFLELHPSTEPTASMLPKWLSARSLPPTAGEFLERLNALISDHDAHIGPSYFMKKDQSNERIRRIWETQIEPLLRETYYDTWKSVASQFDFDQLWAAAGGGSRRFDDGNDPVMAPTELPPPIADAPLASATGADAAKT